MGAEPLSLDIGLEVTEALLPALHEVKLRVVNQLKDWGVEVTKK